MRLQESEPLIETVVLIELWIPGNRLVVPQADGVRAGPGGSLRIQEL